MANRREIEVAESYQDKGWKAVRGGWPDWLMIQTDENGNIIDMKAVEVKSPSGTLRYKQKIVRKALEKSGIEYEVEVVE